MKRLIVGKDVKYARSSVDTASTATTPDLLFPGSVGIYGIDPATSKSVLVDAANAASILAAGLDEFIVAVGTTAGGPVVSQPISIAATNTAVLVPGTAPVADVTHKVAVGFNGTTGSMNFPTFADKDAAEVKLIRNTFGINQRVDKDSFEASNIKATDSDYDVLVSLVNAVAARDENTKFVSDNVKILQNIAGVAITNAAAVTNGSLLVTSTAHAIGALDYVSIDGSLYQAVSVNANDFTLDRPYTGATNAALANTLVLDLAATLPTEMGLQFEASEAGLNFETASGETAEDADHTLIATGLIGHGSALWMEEEVRLTGAQMGFYDQIDRRRPAPDFNITAAATYDMYKFFTNPSYASKDEMDAKFSTNYQVKVAFVDGGAADNQSVFEATVELLYGGVVLTPA